MCKPTLVIGMLLRYYIYMLARTHM
jgi:hypothetical protein